jgi:hypothetical protein
MSNLLRKVSLIRGSRGNEYVVYAELNINRESSVFQLLRVAQGQRILLATASMAYPETQFKRLTA